MQLTSVDWLIMGVYFAFVLGIGVVLRRHTRTSTDFFLAGRAIPAWVCGLAFLSANLGAQEVIGMAASGAKYGIVTSHCRDLPRAGDHRVGAIVLIKSRSVRAGAAPAPGRLPPVPLSGQREEGRTSEQPPHALTTTRSLQNRTQS